MGASREALGVKNTAANAGDIRDLGSIPGLGRSYRGGHSNPLQYSCLENPSHKELDATEQLSTRAERGWMALTGLHPASEPWGPPDRLPVSRGSTTPLAGCSSWEMPGSLHLSPSSSPSPHLPFPPILSTQNLFLILSPHGHQPLSGH